MKLKFLWCAFLLVTAAQAASPDSDLQRPQVLKPSPEQAKTARLASEVLTRYHYKSLPLDDAMSGEIFDHFLKSLDPEKLFFIQADIDKLMPLRSVLDDAIIKEDLAAPFAIFNLYVKRLTERFGYARILLRRGFDFRKDESFQYVRTKAPWPKSETELREVWRKRVKDDWLRLRLAGKDDGSIAGILDKRYAGVIKRIGRLKSADAFQAFMNAYTTAIEPHTNYFAPRVAEDFNIAMKLSLMGIGAGLTDRDDYTVIRELISGGPAAGSGQLKIGDRIVGVGQDGGGAITDILGWRIDDVVTLIRGPADTTVVLEVLPADAGLDGKHRLVSLVRKKITLEEQSAKQSVITVTEDGTTRRIGIISLPGFYEDALARQQGDQNFKSATRDVVRLVDELKTQNIDALLVDLRNNGGGSMQEAVELTGLFIGSGPVVQQRDAKGNVAVGSASYSGVAWDGPLGVLINRGSASASEIFAAAIQDYGRGLIIGEPSFGKGTVQTLVDLDAVAKNDQPKYGELKMTIAQFFRINGGTTQLKGVEPDINLPFASDADNFGESSFENALPWTQVPISRYAPIGNPKSLAPALLARHEERVKSDKDFVCLENAISSFNFRRKKNLVSLNESNRRKERDAEEARRKSCDGENVAAEAGKKPADGQNPPADQRVRRDDGLLPDERNLATELAIEKSGKNAKDVLLNEAGHILSDEIAVIQRNARFLTGKITASGS